MTPRPAPWQVWWCEFDPQVGREQAGLRPAIIISTALGCQVPNGLIMVVPCTTRNRGLGWQPGVSINSRASWAMTDQMKSVSLERLRSRAAAAITAAEASAIRDAIRMLVDV